MRGVKLSPAAIATMLTVTAIEIRDAVYGAVVQIVRVKPAMLSNVTQLRSDGVWEYSTSDQRQYHVIVTVGVNSFDLYALLMAPILHINYNGSLPSMAADLKKAHTA